MYSGNSVGGLLLSCNVCWATDQSLAVTDGVYNSDRTVVCSSLTVFGSVRCAAVVPFCNDFFPDVLNVSMVIQRLLSFACVISPCKKLVPLRDKCVDPRPLES